MKLNQKILKAINEGIRKSLLSFDDVEFDKSNPNHKVNKTISDWKWIQDNFVDLGLPSGTLWCKWNIGAMNGNTVESWYGNHYAWGELSTKDSYTKENYTYKENPEVLPLSNDIAYQTNNLMHMPTLKQIGEIKELPNKWVTNYNGISNLTGVLFTGHNGNELFIPAAGYHESDDIVGRIGSITLWSSEIDNVNNNFACYLDFNSKRKGDVLGFWRYRGRSVRGVIDEI